MAELSLAHCVRSAHAERRSASRPPIIRDAVNIACGIVFGIEEKGIAENGSKLDRPGYHHMLCLPSTQKRIKDIASALLVRWQVIADVSALYADAIVDADKDADKDEARDAAE
jgi:hypothetical protein